MMGEELRRARKLLQEASLSHAAIATSHVRAGAGERERDLRAEAEEMLDRAALLFASSFLSQAAAFAALDAPKKEG